MKSAYELALERMEHQGIERPREEALSKAEREQVAEARRKAEAKIAELEILHNGRSSNDPTEREQADKDFRYERQRIEEKRDREIERIRKT